MKDSALAVKKRWHITFGNAGTGGRPDIRGLTFLEIIMVITILSLLFFLATPRFKGTFLKNQLRTTTRDLATLMRLARSEAIYAGNPAFLKINVNEAWYELTLPKQENDEDKDSYRGRHKRRNEFEERRYLPLEVEFEEVSTDMAPDPDNKSVARVIFFSNGTASGATIVLENKKGKAMTIDVAPSTGFTRVYDGSPG